GLFTEEQIATTCCFATQDKVWVTGPGGERWEVYTVLADSETFGTAPDPSPADTEATGVCCGTAAEAEAEGACCGPEAKDKAPAAPGRCGGPATEAEAVGAGGGTEAKHKALASGAGCGG